MNRHQRIQRWLRQFALCVLPLALCAGCEFPGKPNPADKPKLPDQNLSFSKLFAENCVGCHGANGKFGPAPPVNDPLFVAIVPDDVLLSVIRDGRLGTPMPPFARDKGGSLTDQQVLVIAEGIRSHWKSDEQPSEPPPAYATVEREGTQPLPGSHERGSELFARACADCHGANGTGIEQEGALANAINVPAFLALISDQAIRRIIITGRPDLGMPNFAEDDGRPSDFKPLTSADVDDLVALISHWRATGNSVTRTVQSDSHESH